MKLLTGLFRAVRKRMLTVDTDMGMFRDKLDVLVKEKDKLSDDEISARVEEIKKFTDDLPESDGKSQVIRYLEDFKAIKEQDGSVAQEAASAVADMFEKLDAEAMKDAPEVTEETRLVESSAPEVDEEETEEIVEETEAKDADPNAEYTLEEIYQFIKKRMAEDTEEELEDSGEELEEFEEEEIEDGCEEEIEEEVVTDHAPRIPVTIRNSSSKGSLTELFKMAKGGF